MQWPIARESAGDAVKPNTRHLELAVNGNTVTRVAFERTSRWEGCRTGGSGISVVIPARASLAPRQAACGRIHSAKLRAGYPNCVRFRAWETREARRLPQTRSRIRGCVGFN